MQGVHTAQRGILEMHGQRLPVCNYVMGKYKAEKINKYAEEL
jgi:hypothetical protein